MSLPKFSLNGNEATAVKRSIDVRLRSSDIHGASTSIYGTVSLGTIVYVLFEALAPFKAGYYVFLVLACLAAIFIVTRFWRSFPIIVGLFILQSPFPAFRGYEESLGYNWYTIDLCGVSIVHYLVGLCAVIGVLHGFLKGFRLKRGAAEVLGLLSIAFIMELAVGVEWKVNGYQYAVDAAIFGYVVVFLFLGFLAPLQIRQRLIQYFLISLPLSLAWGNIFLMLIARKFYPLATHYDVVGVYLLAGLLLNCFSPLAWSLRSAIRRCSFATLIAYLSLHVTKLGSILLLTMVMVGLIVAFWWVLHGQPQTTLKVLLVFVLVCLMASGFLYYAYKVGNPVTRQKIGQITSLFTSSGDPVQMRHSTAVRVVELINIWAALQESPLTFIFGRGAGGYFIDNYFSFPYLTTTDYSADQRLSRKFYKPHNNPGYVLLKNGLFGAILWFTILVIVVIQLIFLGETRSPKFGLGVLLIATLATVYGFTVKNSLLVGLLGALYITAPRLKSV